jgi:hypothetical protein
VTEGSALGEVAVRYEQDGRRLVAWTTGELDGSTVTIEHDFPDALSHHYMPRGINENVPLYEGAFTLDGDRDPFEGDVTWRWYPSPRIQARGTRATSSADLRNLFDTGQRSMWVDPRSAGIELTDGTLPDQPSSSDEDLTNVGFFVDELVQQDLGDSAGLDRVTFLVANGLECHDASGVADPNDLKRFWHGRTTANGAGWGVTFDRCAEMDHEEWRSLRDVGGHRFTHIGSLVRSDGSAFTGNDAWEALARVRVAMTIALGRRTPCCLPVGWRVGRPVWTGWYRSRVDRHVSATHWIDKTVGSQQLSLMVSKVLEFGTDAARWSAVKAATAYYVAANVDVDVELTASIPVSALQLLAYFRFVSDRGTHSKRAWDAMTTEDQVRLLLDDMKLDLAITPTFKHLLAVRDRLAVAGRHRDALGVIIRMRDTVTHPTRDHPDTFDIYEWAEAGMHARYWLCLALLNTVGYDGPLARALEATPHHVGHIGPVPWAASAG